MGRHLLKRLLQAEIALAFVLGILIATAIYWQVDNRSRSEANKEAVERIRIQLCALMRSGALKVTDESYKESCNKL